MCFFLSDFISCPHPYAIPWAQGTKIHSNDAFSSYLIDIFGSRCFGLRLGLFQLDFRSN